MKFQIDQNKVEQFGKLDFLARQIVEGFITGLHKSPFHGFSVEFAEHRLYNAGESVKNIDWKLYGRTDKLFVKRFEEETNLRCQFVIDQSSSMYYPLIDAPDISNPNKITYSVYAVAVLMHMIRRQRDAAGISVFSDKLDSHTDCRSSSVHHRHLYTLLEKILQPITAQTHRKTFAADALHKIADIIHKRSLVVVLSDMMESLPRQEEMFRALQHLRHNKHEVLLFHVVDKNKELDFDFENRPYRFIDMESGKELKLRPYEVKDKYLQAIREYKKELELRCAQFQIDFVEIDINQGFDQLMLSYLAKRKKLY